MELQNSVPEAMSVSSVARLPFQPLTDSLECSIIYFNILESVNSGSIGQNWKIF